MAVKTTITKSPAGVSFAGNPIVYQVRTNKGLGEEESFLRILCKATFTLNGAVDWYVGSLNFTVELSQTVADFGTAVFNLSDSAQTLIRNIQSSIDMNGDAPFPAYGLIANIEFKTSWVYENQELQSEAEYAPMLFVVPGALTDFELLTMDDIYLPSLAEKGKAMTRKPDGGIIYGGEVVVVPTLYTYYDSSNQGMLVEKESKGVLAVDGKIVSETISVISCNELDYQVISVPSYSVDGSFVFSSDLTRSFSGHFRNNRNGVHSLRFINGFGAVESISVRSRDKLSYEVSGENHSLVQEIGVRPTDRRYSTKSQPVGVYELSSGYVPQRWAEWYVQELLTSPRVWIQLGGKWIPALIEASDECVIYDRSNPEMPHVDFTLRLAVDGVTGCAW